MTVRYLSVCSGIEAATQAWRPLGWSAAAFAEIAVFPAELLAHRFPDVPNLGDFTAINPDDAGAVDLLVGGTPCQSFSVAGLRRSLADGRGNLTLAFVRLAHALRSIGSLRWLIWENVPGILSTADNAFGCFLGGLIGADAPLHSPLERGRWPRAGMAAGPVARAAWRVLDAQYFGLAQRRARLFLVAGFGDGADPAAVLFEPKGVPGHPAARRETGQNLAGTLGGRNTAGGGLGTDFECGGGLQVARTLTAKGGAGRFDAETETFLAHALTGEGFDASEDGTGRGTPLVPIPILEAGARAGKSPDDLSADTGFAVGGGRSMMRGEGHAGEHAAVAVSLRGRDGGTTAEMSGDIMPALRASGGGGDKAHALAGMAVRRLTPRECERLQGFPDDYTLIPISRQVRRRVAEDMAAYSRRSGQELSDADLRRLAADGPRYRAIGNSMAVPVMRWLGERIALAERITF